MGSQRSIPRQLRNESIELKGVSHRLRERTPEEMDNAGSRRKLTNDNAERKSNRQLGTK